MKPTLVRAVCAVSISLAVASCAAAAPAGSGTQEGAPLTPASGAGAPARGTPLPPGSAGDVGTAMPEFPGSAAALAWLNGAPVRVSEPPGEVLLVESWHRL